MSAISAQVALYPLRQADLGPAISKAIEIYRAHGLVVSSGTMSTVIAGEADAVFDALKASFRAADALGDVVMTASISNCCPMPDGTAPDPQERTMAHTDTTATLAQSLLDPARWFATPEDVLTRGDLTREQKVEILKRWEYDAAEADVATEEGMPGEDGGALQLILMALSRLEEGSGPSRTGPSKQHALL